MAELAWANVQSGEFGKAQNCVSEAFEAMEKTKERWAEAEIHRTAGMLSLGMGKPHEAEAHLIRSLSVARSQHAKSWELRAATCLARLWNDQDRRSEAREVLAPVYGWFTEGFDTFDLKQAKTLLDEFHGCN
ncbi:MAG: hypothetical protein WBL84_21220 [Xanthobacteraceae bacterium]|jgi:predicted ATPase